MPSKITFDTRLEITLRTDFDREQSPSSHLTQSNNLVATFFLLYWLWTHILLIPHCADWGVVLSRKQTNKQTKNTRVDVQNNFMIKFIQMAGITDLKNNAKRFKRKFHRDNLLQNMLHERNLKLYIFIVGLHCNSENKKDEPSPVLWWAPYADFWLSLNKEQWLRNLQKIYF